MTDKKFQKKLAKLEKQGERYKQEYEIREAYVRYLPERKKRKVSNVMLIIIVIAIVGYAVANFILQYTMGVEISSTLTTCWYSFWGAEIVSLAAIKTSKVRNGSSEVYVEDDFYVEEEICEDDEICE